MRNGPIISAVIGVLLALLAGCASTPQASLGTDADAKRFDSAPNAAIIYIYRPIGAGQGVSTIWLDGRLVGDSLPQSFFRVAARPGHNRITTAGNDPGRLEFDTRADEVYFVEARVEGESHSESISSFRLVTPESGKTAIVGCCRMLEAWRPGQPRLLNY
jgi:hypothetical protein